MRRLLSVILGGIADHAVDGLGRRTPLQVARTPNLDHLAMLGGCGVYHPTVVGEPVSETLALFLMLGNPPDMFPGRAVFEAISRGVELCEGKYYMLCEPAYVEEGILVETRHFESEDEEASFYEYVSSRVESLRRLDSGLYLLELGEYISPTHPGVVGAQVVDTSVLEGVEVIPEGWEGNAARRDKGLAPINRLLFYGGGRFLRSNGTCFPIKMRFYTDSHMFHGLVRWMGCDVEFIPSKSPKQWLTEIFGRVLREFEELEGVFVYTDYIHRANIQTRAWRRVEVIEEMDAAFSIVLDNMLKEEVMIMVTSDVTAPSSGDKPYSGLPVPVLMTGEGVRRGMSTKFDEAMAGSGSLGTLRGKELLLTLFSYMGFLYPVGV